MEVQLLGLENSSEEIENGISISFTMISSQISREKMNNVSHAV